MDTSYYGDQIIKRCYNMQKNLRSINIVHNTSNNLTALWNRFQIFLFKNLEFDCNEWYQSDPEFQIYDLLISNNCLVCLDYTGNIHIALLKFKGAQKRFHYGFNPREQGVMACSTYIEDYTLCLKYESDAYFLSVHKINTEFKLEKRVIIMCDEPLQQIRDNYILKAHPITEKHIDSVKKVFSNEEMVLRNNYHLVVISFDRLSVYACLFSTRMTAEEVTLIKLYTCPSKISNIEFVAMEDLNIVVGLAIGTLVSLNLSNISKPQIIHLNTAIHNFLVTNDTVIYTDGLSMWKGEKILSEKIKFTEFLVKNVKDLVNVGEQIICSTYNDFIYTLPVDDERSYKPSTVDEYCAAEKLLDSSKYLEKILDEVKKNESLIKRQIKERNYITALSLSNRQDIMDTIITQKIIVYENYEDAILENTDVILTNKFSEYFDTESFYFLIQINSSSDHRLNDILSNNLGDLRLHITIRSENKVVKTTTIKVTDVLKKITLLIPLKTKFINTTEMIVQTKMVTNMPGALDVKQKIWIILYRKTEVLNSEHFIKFNFNAQKNTCVCLKKPKETIQEMIVQTAMNQYSNLIEITDIASGPELRKWNMYVRLPSKYAEIFRNEGTSKKFTSKKVNYFLQQFASEDFLKSKSCLTLSVAKEKVSIGIENDGFSNPSLKVSSHNAKIVLDIRNFLSNLIYTVFTDLEPGKEFISHSFYITVENLQKSVRECLSRSSVEDMLLFIEQFERKVVGLLPI